MNDSPLSSFSDQLANAVDRALASVVAVRPAQGRPISGVVAAPELVVTVDHVIASDSVEIAIDDVRLDGSVVGRDHVLDLALVRVPGLEAPPAAEGGEPRLGAWVLAVARPGNAPMVSSGVLSGFGQVGRRVGPGTRWLRTDATPYPGFSGSALVDVAGALVGVVNAGLSRGEVLALPVSVALAAARSLAERGSVERGYLGIATQAVRVGPETGLLVVNVEEGSAASSAGLLIGDVLLHWNGEPLGSGEGLLERVAVSANTTVHLDLLRGGAPLALDVTVGSRRRS